MAGKGRAMDGMLTEFVREMRTDVGPRPFVTTQATVVHALKGDVPCPLTALLDAERLSSRRDLRADRLLALCERRRISRPEARAASEMRLIIEWEAGAMEPLARSQFRERLAASAYGGSGELWLATMEAEHARYAPWRAWARETRVNAQGTAEDLTRRIVIDGQGLRQVEEDMRLRKDGRCLGWLRRSLHRYACLAGWQAGDEPPMIEMA